jgi:hypothetical protein
MGHHEFHTAFVDGFEDLPASVDEAAVGRMRAVAKLLDEQVEIPGTGFRIGIDPLVGAVPVVGDAVGAAVSLYIVAEAAYLGVSFSTVVRMLGNVAVDAVGGSVPYLGVVFDAVWKTNKRNLRLALNDLVEKADREAGPATGPGTGETDADSADTATDEGSDGPVVIEVE